MEEIADLIFSIFIGYVGALEFLYVVRHLYHWAGQHSQQQLQNGDASSLEQLQANLRQQLATATEREANSGHKAMQDGVLYEQGFRIEPNAKELEQLKQEQKQAVQQKEQRRKALEAELKKQKQIEEQTRQQLAAAEAALAAQRKQQEEEAAIAAENERRMLEAERQREAEEKALELAEETAKAAAAAKEAEGQHAAEQKALEQAEEAAKAAAAAEHEQRLLEAQRQREAEQRALEEAEEVAKATAEAAAEAEENERRLLEAERQREAEQRALEEGEEMAKAAAAAEAADHEQRLLEAERQREAEQRALEEAEEVAKAAAAAEAAEHEQRLLEAQRQREAEQRALEEAEEVAKAEAAAAAEAEAEENERRLLEAEHQREAEQRALEEGEEVAADEAAENEREILDADPHSDVELNELESEQETESMQISADTADNLFEAERLREEEQRRRELEEEEEALENARKIIAADKLREIAQQQLLDAEEDAVANGNGDTPSSTLLLEAEQTTDERDRKQQLIAENARKFLEAEQEMVELQQRLANEPVVHKVKTQMNQTNKLLFPSLSDEGSSVEPNSSTQTSISTQPSEELNTTGNEQPQILHLQRQEPDGEDNIPSPPYTDEYLRSLDGIKSRSLLREDGSGRRRAFKKRRSSGSSNSSRDSRTSRDEELKMFTSLEEEEMQSLQKSDSDYTPIKYSTEQTLKVKGHHHRRHKRSPAKDAKTPDVQADAMRESLEMLDEENTNPWGEFVPEHYKHTEFWKREKALSIDEEEMEIDLAKLNSAQPTQSYGTSSFEEATHAQNEQVLAELQQHQEQTDELENKAMEMESAADAEVTLDAAKTPTESENKSNLNTSQISEDQAVASMRESVSPRLRRSPRIEDMDKYEDEWVESHPTAPQTPLIKVERNADVGPWRNERGQLLQGLSDFYDFATVINASRSRSTSRNPSPAPTAKPKNISYESALASETTIAHVADVYDDTNQSPFDADEFSTQQVVDIIAAAYTEVSELNLQLENVADHRDTDSAIHTTNAAVLMVNVLDQDDATNTNAAEMSALVETLRDERLRSHSNSASESRSRSHSPRPSSNQVERSLEARRNKRIKQNDELYEQLTGMRTRSSGSPQLSDDGDSAGKQDVGALVESLRAERVQSHALSRSCSPLPTAGNIQRSIEARRHKRIQQNDEMLERLTSATELTTSQLDTPTTDKLSADCRRSRSRSRTPLASTLQPEHSQDDQQSGHEDSSTAAPSILVECIETCTTESQSTQDNEMNSLVAKLRLQRSTRSRSKSPMRLPSAQNMASSIDARRKKLVERNDELLEDLAERAKSPEPPRLTVEYVYEIQEDVESESVEVEDEDIPAYVECQSLETAMERGHSSSRTPSRSASNSPNAVLASQETLTDYIEFHTMLNLEASDNRTLTKSSEELETQLASKLRELDMEALHLLSTAQTETELKTITPTPMPKQTEPQAVAPIPDYDRTISEEQRDVERIKTELLTSGFKRSTYVGESMELGAEYEPLRREAAKFQRSRSPSPSLYLANQMDIETAKRYAAEQRAVQASILAQLIDNSGNADDPANKHGAKPKTTLERSSSRERLDTQRIREEQLRSGSIRSTHVCESLDLDCLRREAADFRRSQSKSRSPEPEITQELAAIEAEVQRREFQDQLLDEIEAKTKHFKEFSRYLNTDFLDSERRASDSALMQKASELMENALDDMEPEEYHHFRRFSVYQEPAVEEYPNDDLDEGYVCVSQIEVQTPGGTTTWVGEQCYSQQVLELDEQLAKALDAEEMRRGGNAMDELDYIAQHDEDSDGSEIDRQTVVEVDDEIDTDLADYNERGPTDESHHEISECEEADREHDRYAGRGAQDWSNTDEPEFLVLDMPSLAAEEGAVGGASAPSTASAYDSDSFTIDQIYNDAIKNRKQSGILRDYDCILQEMSHSFSERDVAQPFSENDRERYALWAKTRALEKTNHMEVAQTFIEQERRDTEAMRYLGDAEATARQSARLRSRYGYLPLLQTNNIDELEVDLNYKPRREYNWRKNFKIDDDDNIENAASQQQRPNTNNDVIDAATGATDEVSSSAREPNETNDTAGNGSVDSEVAELNGNGYDIELIEPNMLDTRKYSLGGESITLFSRSPDRELLEQVIEEPAEMIDKPQQMQEVNGATSKEKPKKKKSKKKTRKEYKANDEFMQRAVANDDDDDDDDNTEYADNQHYNRRSSSLQMEAQESPKRISRSRRSSKANSNDEALFSPRSSVGLTDAIWDINEEYTDQPTNVNLHNTAGNMQKKKTKKRKKHKDECAQTKAPQQPTLLLMQELSSMPMYSDGLSLSCELAGDADNAYLLATISPQHSVCVTPLSDEAELQPLPQQDPDATPSTVNAAAKPTPPADTVVDTFELLKDGNFYPLF